ncbi:hypothetical protein PRIPAC_89991, partial [Pristionchus pacificus]|uniref:Uncharacterized protein n=1 Tax=Pristionchus pacificus TaxID=54126 RepID=A0A8R1YYJ0_PRIPA
FVQIMASIPTPGDQREGSAPGIGDEDVGGMNEGDMDYIDRPQEQGGYAEISDHQGNNFQVSLEDLAAVGVDINKQLEISEEQMNMLLSMMNQDGLPAGPMGSEEYEDSAGNDPITISIQSDGGIKLVTAGGHESFFSSSQLAEINIDTQNLTDDDIKRIVQLAAAATGEPLLYDETMDRPEKRRKLEPSSMGGMEERRERETAVRMQPIQRNYPSILVPSHSAASTSSGHISIPSSNIIRGISNGRRGPSGLIGENVKIQNSKGKIVSAVVRYAKAGNGAQSAAYKVQTADGKFEWINHDRIIDRTPRPIEHRDYDHNRYTSEPPINMHTSGPSTSNAGTLMLHRRIFPVGSGGGMGMRGVPIRPIPLPHHQIHHPPNFCCPVCDKKSYQKEPAYIVIRLPACDSCTRERILIVDESVKGTVGGAGGSVPTGRPSMRSIATDTSDLPKNDERSEEVHATSPPSDEQSSSPKEIERSEEVEGDRSVEEEAGSMDESDGLQSPIVSQPQEAPLS